MDALAAYASSSSSPSAASSSSRPPSPSPDSAAERAAAAEARLAALDAAAEAAEAVSARTVLPDPLAALGAATEPSFLHPAATRQLAPPIHTRAATPADGVVAAAAGGAGPVGGPAPRARSPPRGGVDAVHRMAPPLKQGRDHSDDDSDRARSKRARTGLPEAAAAALLGAAPRPPPARAAAGRATRALPVQDALAHGAALPRRGTAAKERQQRVATRGERASGAWKSEAEMLLRQQFD